MVDPGTLICPMCGGRLIPILYGMPTHDAVEAAKRGEIILGGCVVAPDDPTHGCPECRGRFRERTRSGRRVRGVRVGQQGARNDNTTATSLAVSEVAEGLGVPGRLRSEKSGP